MIARIVLAVIIGVVAYLICLLLGTILLDVNLNWVSALGAFLRTYASLIGLLAVLWQFFTNRFEWS